MKKNFTLFSCTYFVKFVTLFLTGLLFLNTSNAQLVTYSLDKNANVTTANANVTASLHTPGANMQSPSYSNGYRVRANSNPFPQNPTDGFHFDIPLSPKTNYDFSLTGVTANVHSLDYDISPTIVYLSVYYQIDGKGAWRKLNGSTTVSLNAPKSTTLIPINFGSISDMFYGGHSYVFRFYVTATSGNDKNDELRIRDLVFNGQLYTPAALKPAVVTGTLGTPTKYANTVTGSTHNIGSGGVNYHLTNQRGVCWNTIGSPTVADALTTDAIATTAATIATYNSTITGLKVSTKYYVRAYIITQLDTLYGAEVNFTTLPPTIPSVTTNAPTNVLSNKATSGGNITDSGGLAITQKGVCWSTTQGAETATSGVDFTKDGTGSNSFTSILKILAPSTTYYAKAYAINSLGISYGNEITFKTDVPVPTISAIPATLAFGTVLQGSPSPLLSYTLSGKYLTPLTGTITVKPPVGFSISTSTNSGFVTSPAVLTISYTNGTLANTVIYVKMLTNLYASHADSMILHAGGSAVNPNIDTVKLSGGVSVNADVLTNVGTDFWFGHGLQANMRNAGAFGLKLQVATGAQASSIKVSIPGVPSFAPLYYNIPANSVQIVQGFPTSGVGDCRLYYTGISNNAIHLEVTNNVPVAAYVYDYATNNSAGASMVFPSNTWNSSYIVQTYGGAESNTGIPNTFFFVIAKEDNTVVTFKPTNSILDSASSPIISNAAGGTVAYPANTTTGYKVTLNKGQVFNAVGLVDGTTKISYDLTGTAVTSDCSKPIAVFAGNSRTLINAAGPGCTVNSGSDNLIQQMFPKVAWGTKYLTVPTKSMEYNLFRISVQDPATVVKVDGAVLPKTIPTWNATGQFYQVEGNKYRKIESDIPINVTQFILPGSSCGGSSVGNNGEGDPEMIILSAVQQSINSTTVYSSGFSKTSVSNGATYINVVIPKGGVPSFKLDAATNINQMVDTGSSSFTGLQYGPSASIKIDKAFKPHPQDPNYSFAKFRVSYPATHTMSSDSGFNAIAYGVADGESWGYNAGTAIKDLTAVVTTTTPFGSASSATTCLNNTTGVNISLPYDPAKVSSLQWISTDDQSITPRNDMTTVSTNATSPIGSFIKDGVTYYTYASPKNYRFDSVGTFKFVVTASGTFTSECGGSKTFNVIMNVVKDTANFTFAPISCGSLQYNFRDTSSPSLGNTLQKWEWTFGNAGTDNIQHPSFNFPSKSIYNVKLRTINNIGCFADTTIVLDLTGGVVGKITATPDTVCLGTAITFDGSTSNSSNGTITKYYWDFGDSKKDTTATPSVAHTYTTAGKYRTSLIVETGAGCRGALVDTAVFIAPIPVADFKLPAAVCIPGNTSFVNQSDETVYEPMSYQWDFGDSKGTSTAKNPVYAYTAAPSASGYTVKLIAISKFGCVSLPVTKTVIDVFEKPIAIFSADAKTCFGDSTVFTDASTALNQKITNWYWDFGDATNSILQSPKHKYTTVKSFNARLAVTTDKGCTSDTSVAKVVKINPLPVAGFILPGSCLGSGTVTFTDTAKITPDDGTQKPFTYVWDFGDPTSTNNTSTAQNGQHTYTAPALYSIKQTVTTQNGCFASVTTAFDIAGSKPKPGFAITNVNNLCSNLPVQLKDTSRIDIGTIKKVEIIWDVVNNPTVIETDNTPSNGAAGSSKNYPHIYPVSATDKTYTVKLTAYSGTTCLDVTTQTITLHGRPVVAFASQVGICANATARTITGATESTGLAGAFTYSGPGVSADKFNPATATVGANAVQAMYTTSFGCKDSFTRNITVWPLPTADFAYSIIACAKGTTSFTDKSVANIGNLKTWSWNFADANATGSNPNTSTIAAPSHIYAVANTYTVNLTVTNDSGCTATVPKSVVINPLPAAKFTIPASICLPDGNGTFTDASTAPAGSTLSYAWNFGDPNNTSGATTPSPTHKFSAVSDYMVKLTVTVTATQCAHDTTIKLPMANIHAQPKAAFVVDTANICLGDIITATDKSTGTVTQSLWTFSNSLTATGSTATVKYPIDGAFTIAHSIIDNFGCPSDIPTKNVIVNSLPVVNAGPDKRILLGRADVLSATAFGNNLKYLWTPSLPSAYLDYDTLLNPVCMPLTDVTYTFTVTATGGCKNSDDMNVILLRVPRIPNIFTPNGDNTNDFWDITYLNQFPGATVDVYNRYGQLVFQKLNGYTTPWDGKMNGTPLPVGTYYYVINPKNGLDKMVGNVTIVR